MRKALTPLIFLLTFISVGFPDTAVENAVWKLSTKLETDLSSDRVSIPPSSTAALVGVRRGEDMDEESERLMSAQLWRIASKFKFTMLDRKYVDERLKELGMSVSDLFDPQNAPRIGRFLGASYLFVGELVRKGRVKEISMRLIETETGAIRWEGLVRGYPHKLPAVSALLSLILPGTGQLMNESEGRSVVFLGSAVGLATAAFIYHSRYSDAHDRYLKATNIDDINRYYDESRTPYRMRNLFLGLYSLCAIISSAEAYRDAVLCERGRRYVEVSASFDEGIIVALRGVW
jgi:hypothetical protein